MMTYSVTVPSKINSLQVYSSKQAKEFPMVSWCKYWCQLASSYSFQIYATNWLFLLCKL